MELNLLHVHGPMIGYGRLGVELDRALRRMGIETFDHMPDPDGYYEHFGNESRICGTVCWVSTPTHARGWWKGQTPIIFTMWEATELPESFRENLHEFDMVVVPSEHNAELFGRYHERVRCVPLGVDPEVWRYQPRQPPGQFFTFLCAGSGSRKGTDLAYKAFRKVFKMWPRTGPVPRLVFKSPRGAEFYGERLEVVSGRISAEEEVALYADAHCYLQPSRGEGFGLQPLQAMAQGCPTILTAAHGHAAFAHLGYGLSSTLTDSGYFIYGDAGQWWEPSLDELCERMEYVYHHYDAACERATASAACVAERFTWARTAQAFVEAVGPERLTPYDGPGEWYEPVARLYLTITNRDWACDVAGSHYQFRKGERTWVPADVKRILLEADLLDVACLHIEGDEDIGLAPHQVKRLPEYIERHSRCWTCGQPLPETVCA